MRPCGFANCPHQAEALVRIAGVGDRRACSFHLAWMTENAMAFRRLDISEPVPEWRTRSLARDMTGAVIR